VTVKTRLGWNHEQLVITTLAEQLQDCGIKALTIHGRTRSQMYTGQADWTLIGEVKRNPRITIPIIGNGDITTPQQAADAFNRYGVDAIMVGRATFGRPWIFKEIRDYLDAPSSSPAALSSSPAASSPSAPSSFPAALSSSPAPSSSPVRCAAPLAQPLPPVPLTFDQKLDILIEQLRINVERIDEYRGILHTRRHLAATPIFKGIPDFRQTRIAMLRAETMADLLAILEDCRHRLSDREIL
jgi:tRNA-dihydrouridine synthase